MELVWHLQKWELEAPGRAHSAPPRLLNSVNSHQKIPGYSAFGHQPKNELCREELQRAVSSAEHTTNLLSSLLHSFPSLSSPWSLLLPPAHFWELFPVSGPAGFGTSSQETGGCRTPRAGVMERDEETHLLSIPLFATKGISSISTRALEEVSLSWQRGLGGVVLVL